MPQPTDLQLLEDPLLQAYAQAWSEVDQLQRELIDDPLRATKRRRLLEMQRSIERSMLQLNDDTAQWLTDVFPDVYGIGGVAGAAEAGGEFVWTTIHQEAVQNLVNRTYTDLLSATQHVQDTTKVLVRRIVRDEVLQKSIQGRTAVDAGKRVAQLIERRGISAVIYRDGSQHGLAEYGQMVVRTVSATAYNEGSLNAAHSLGVVYWECFDGPDCGWTFHDDTEEANGKIVTRDEALSWPISHPNCRRSFGARPDLTTPSAAANASPSVTESQNEAQKAADAARNAAASRRQRRASRSETRAQRLEARRGKVRTQ